MENDNLILTLGTAQDGGFPHIGCNLNCCRQAKKNPSPKYLQPTCPTGPPPHHFF